MSDINKPEQQPEEQGYTPASPVKRAMAWIGVVYMVILVALITCLYFGLTLVGIAPLLAVPGLIGLGIVAVISHRTTGQPGKCAAWILTVVCWLLALLTLPVGIAGLMANFV